MNSEPRGEIRQVTEQASDYPAALRELADRPPVLYIKGRWPIPESRRIGIVGTRRATAYGLDVTQSFTQDLVNEGVVTVSGLAAGIDACAHRVTLQGGGWTVAVLGHGFGYRYPKENGTLYDEIARQGTLVTEFPYETAPQASNFPQRNRIISGLSQGVLVMEAGHRSGALITARCAAEQGRDVFVVPGSIFSPYSVGCHRLIKEGAQLVESAQEILEEYGWARSSSFPPVSGGEPMGPPPEPAGDDGKRATAGNDIGELSRAEMDLLKLFALVPLSVDELVELSGQSVDRLAEALLTLEIKGRIQHLPGQQYLRYGSSE